MPGKIEHRQVTPLLRIIRDILRGRGHTDANRFSDLLAPRTLPPPTVPGGPYHRTTKMYYYTRDARREVQPPVVISIGKQITAGDEGAAKGATKAITPGKTHQWD